MEKNISGKCDKCKKPVPTDNDATIIDAIVTGNPVVAFFATPRHFLPTDDCQGSPSRAQYIEGQEKDQRGYPYNPELETKYRIAFSLIQAEHGKTLDDGTLRKISEIVLRSNRQS